MDKPGLGFGEPKIVWAVPCNCTGGDRTERVLARARIPERYRHCDFENFETDNEKEGATREQLDAWKSSLARAKLVVQRFAQEFPVGCEDGILLMGPSGVGKTHLVVSALKEVVLRGHSGVFYDYRELLKQIQGSYNAESPITEMSILDPVLSVEVLVLDDLGSSTSSPWALETVGHILNTRYNKNRVTLLTTNYLDRDLESGDAVSTTNTRVAGMREPKREDTLSDRVGKRIRSRLYEMCRTIEISSLDYRKDIRNASRFHP
jgi:DNA replication protein DnaC